VTLVPAAQNRLGIPIPEATNPAFNDFSYGNQAR
jgi:hypothetical protein